MSARDVHGAKFWDTPGKQRPVQIAGVILAVRFVLLISILNIATIVGLNSFVQIAKALKRKPKNPQNDRRSGRTRGRLPKTEP